jgi:predicted transcriptional regulator
MKEKLAYTVDEVAALTGFSRDTITRIFEKEPGVLILNRPTKMNKRRYRSIRIPHSVYERVRQRYEV